VVVERLVLEETGTEVDTGPGLTVTVVVAADAVIVTAGCSPGLEGLLGQKANTAKPAAMRSRMTATTSQRVSARRLRLVLRIWLLCAPEMQLRHRSVLGLLGPFRRFIHSGDGEPHGGDGVRGAQGDDL
jgi:hypothetical protein